MLEIKKSELIIIAINKELRQRFFKYVKFIQRKLFV